MANKPDVTIFVTIKKHHAAIIPQPVTCYERFKQGKNEGKVKAKRQIQYCEDLNTIFVDEQKKIDDKPTVSPLYFTKKPMTVDNDNIVLIDFMKAHPLNIANGGDFFKELDVNKEEEFQLEAFEALDKSKNSLMNAEDNLVRAAAVWFLGTNYASHTINKLKITLRTKLELNLKMLDGKTSFVHAFNSFVADKNNDEKLMISVCLEKGLITVIGGKKIAWGNSDEVIFNGSQPANVVKEFATWLKNDEEGRNMSAILLQKLEES